MTVPKQPLYADFMGAYGDNSTGTYYPARAEASNGFVSLWVAGTNGWSQFFSVPATEVSVKSAAQRITLVVRGQSFPLLADPGAVNRALGLNTMGLVANVRGEWGPAWGLDAGRAMNQVSAANAFNAGGGPQFIQAARLSGARVSRLGYGAVAAIGCVSALVLVVLVTVITVAVLNN